MLRVCFMPRVFFMPCVYAQCVFMLSVFLCPVCFYAPCVFMLRVCFMLPFLLYQCINGYFNILSFEYIKLRIDIH